MIVTSRPFVRLITLALPTLVWLLTAQGCSTMGGGVAIENDSTQSLNFIRYVINQVAPRGIRAVSENQREIYSGYFLPSNMEKDAADRSERAFAHFMVLGAERPYTTRVEVIRERRMANGSYKSSGEDKRLSKLLAKRLEDKLAKSREDTNFVDDYRPF